METKFWPGEYSAIGSLDSPATKMTCSYFARSCCVRLRTSI